MDRKQLTETIALTMTQSLLTGSGQLVTHEASDKISDQSVYLSDRLIAELGPQPSVLEIPEEGS